MNALLTVSRAIDAVNLRIGRWFSWLVLVAVLVSAMNAVSRKLFDISSNAWLELQWVLFGMVFLLCSPWTLLSNEHIRIDIVNNALPRRVRDWIDLLGHLFFLLPFTIVMLITSWPFFVRSFRIDEQSQNAGGLPQWPAKGMLFVGFALLFFQALSEVTKRIAVMQGRIADPHASGGGQHSPIETEQERVLAVPEAERR